MICFKNLISERPFLIFKEKYDEAVYNKQRNIEAMSISTYHPERKEVDARYVNLKFVEHDKFIFFTNYESPKANAFKQHHQIAALFFWPSINTQIRMRAFIAKTSTNYNNLYFLDRTREKNALAISSNQSNSISSYKEVVENYNRSLAEDDLTRCPKYWGGYAFAPYEIEFWSGNKNRLNRRSLYIKSNNCWNESILEP